MDLQGSTYDDFKPYMSKSTDIRYLLNLGAMLAEIEATGHVTDTEENEGCCGAGVDDFGMCNDCKEHCEN